MVHQALIGVLSLLVTCGLVNGVPAASKATPSTKAFIPKTSLGLDDTFVYDLDQTPVPAPVITSKYNVKLNAGVYIVDGEQHSAKQIQNYHNQGKTVICYFSAGSWEPVRSDAKSFAPECYCGQGVDYDKKTGRCKGSKKNQNKLDGWDEWYLDIHNPSCLAKVQARQEDRIKGFKAKGCDGIDPDNVDAYMNNQKFGITQEDEFNYLMWLSQTAKKYGLLSDLKNANGMLVDSKGKATQWSKDLVNAFDFSVIEQCHAQDNCDDYDAFLDAGKPQIQVEYEGDDFTLESCPQLKKGQHLLLYDEDTLNSKKIKLQCNDSA